MMVISDMRAERHMTFLGLPIDGTIYEFKDLMVDKGYRFLEERDQFCFLEGMFTGKDVTLVLVGTPITKTIWKVLVKFEKEIYWSDLKMSFREYENLYKKKYGEPTSNCEEIYPPHKEREEISEANIIVRKDSREITLDAVIKIYELDSNI